MTCSLNIPVMSESELCTSTDPLMRSSHHTRLGQHFLTRPEVAAWVADAADLCGEDTVLEIGPGTGILTRILVARARTVVAIEKDRILVENLQHTCANDVATGKLVLLAEDVRDFDPTVCTHLFPRYVLVANIPYYLTGYILRSFLSTAHQPTHMALLMQKEVAERIVAHNGKESLLSLSVKAYGEPGLVRTVRPGAFSPPPAVTSAILAVRNINRSAFLTPEAERAFFTMIRSAFAHKRKRLGNTLPEICAHEPTLATLRPEDVPLQVWLRLAHTGMH